MTHGELKHLQNGLHHDLNICRLTSKRFLTANAFSVECASFEGGDLLASLLSFLVTIAICCTIGSMSVHFNLYPRSFFQISPNLVASGSIVCFVALLG